MKRLIGLTLALLFLAGCAVQGGNAGAAPATDAVTETLDFYVGSIYSLRYELGDLKDDFTLTPTKARDGNLVKIRTKVLIDADIHLWLDDGREIEKSRSDGNYWEYAFTMPDRDVVITAEPYTKTEIWGFAGTDMDFIKGVRYISPDGGDDDDPSHPRLFWVSSAEELQEYRNIYVVLSEVLEQFDAAFFAENDLIVVVKAESSCSNWHRLTGVKVLPPQTEGKLYRLQPEITRYVPDGGFDTVADMFILIAIDKAHGMAVSELEAPVFTTVKIAG